MSKYLVEKNNESSIKLFNKRKIYRAIMQGQQHNNIVEMDIAEKILYGRVDANFLPIVVDESNLTRLISFENQTIPLSAINFVVDLFEQVVTQFKKCAQTGKIRTDDPFLSNIKAYKAYVDPIEEYKEYLQIYTNSIAGFFIENNVKVTNFDEFREAVMPLLKKTLGFQPLTYAGFLKSKNCSVLSTGLAIEIADSDYINDNEKHQSFMKSPNWEFFVNTCDSYGFMVDLNVPWRIIVDLNSTAAIEAASKYINVNSADQTLFYFFQNSSQKNYTFFKNTLHDVYMQVRKNYARALECNITGELIPATITARAYTYQELIASYNEQYFIDFYTRMRLYEEQPELNDEVVTKIVNNQISFYNSNKNYARLFIYLESQINKTFDKEGSLRYYNNLYKKRNFENFKKGETENLTITEGENDFSGY